jgi:protein TonB
MKQLHPAASLWLGISFLIHGAVFAVVWALSASVVTVSHPIEIDFGVIQQGTPCSIDHPKNMHSSSSAVEKHDAGRKHIVEQKRTVEQQRMVEQPQVARPLLPSSSETAVPVQAPKQVAEIENHSQNSAIMTGPVRQSETAGNGSKGTANASSSSGSGTIDNLPFGSVLGPSFVHKEAPDYPFVARRMNKDGNVLLRLTIDERGKLINTEVVKDAGFGFAEAVIEAVKKSTYRPARRDGIPVLSRALLPVRFELTK